MLSPVLYGRVCQFGWSRAPKERAPAGGDPTEVDLLGPGRRRLSCQLVDVGGIARLDVRVEDVDAGS